jgi:hypothetical protein
MDQPSREAMAGKLQIYADKDGGGDGSKDREAATLVERCLPAAVGQGRSSCDLSDVGQHRVASDAPIDNHFTGEKRSTISTRGTPPIRVNPCTSAVELPS